MVNGRFDVPAPGRLAQHQPPVADGQGLAGRVGIDGIRLDRHAVLGLNGRHRRDFAQYLGHAAFASGFQVLDDDKRHAAASGHASQKLIQGFESPGGGANAHDRERNI